MHLSIIVTLIAFTFLLISKVTYITFKVSILSLLAFPRKLTFDLGVAKAILFSLSYKNALNLNDALICKTNLNVKRHD